MNKSKFGCIHISEHFIQADLENKFNGMFALLSKFIPTAILPIGNGIQCYYGFCEEFEEIKSDIAPRYDVRFTINGSEPGISLEFIKINE